MINKIYEEWENILTLEKASPYRFRTKLERSLNHTLKYAKMENNAYLEKLCDNINYKLNFISDQSNQTSDGCLKSFNVLKQDILVIKNELDKLIA